MNPEDFCNILHVSVNLWHTLATWTLAERRSDDASHAHAGRLVTGSQRAFAEAIDLSEGSVANAERGADSVGDTVFTAIELGLKLPDEITATYLETGDPDLLERIAFDPERNRRPIFPPGMPTDDDDGWTDEDEAFYQALTELLRRQGLKPTPAIIQAMREEWEREQAEQAEQAERHEPGESG